MIVFQFSYFSEFGKKLQAIEYVAEPIAFEKIDCPEFPTLSDEELKKRNFSQDQLIFFSLCCAVIRGTLNSDLIGRKLGPLNHARWLTLGQRILALYISTVNPSLSLKKLASFTIKSYGAIWFLARIHSSVVEAPRYLFQWVKTISEGDSDVFAAVKHILENGSFWFHSENFLLACLGDPRVNVRQKGVDRILQLRNDCPLKAKVAKYLLELKRKKKCQFKTQRPFVKPTLNYQGTDYVEAVCWEEEVLFEPPFTKQMSDEELKLFIMKPLNLDIPSHSVLTERCIRDVDMLSASTTSQEKRDGMIRALQECRKEKQSLKKM